MSIEPSAGSNRPVRVTRVSPVATAVMIPEEPGDVDIGDVSRTTLRRSAGVDTEPLRMRPDGGVAPVDLHEAQPGRGARSAHPSVGRWFRWCRG